MRLCKTCKIEKPLDAFGKHAKSPDGIYYQCKQCRSDYQKAHYQLSPERRAAIRKSDVAGRLRNKQNLYEYKQGKSCMDCGETNWIVFEFDHTSDDKLENVADMVRKTYSWEKILLEISKCDLLCANCHRIRTYNRRNGTIV